MHSTTWSTIKHKYNEFTENMQALRFYIFFTVNCIHKGLMVFAISRLFLPSVDKKPCIKI